MIRHKHFASVLALLLTSITSHAEQADLVITNARIYTMDAARPTAEAIAVRGDLILAVGSNEEIMQLADTGTRELDAAGKTMLPGFHDGHVHTAMAGLKILYECDFSPDLSSEEFASVVRGCADKAPPGAWITGGRWRENIFPDGQVYRDFLDSIVSDRPVNLVHESYHYTVANTRALELAGITRDTPDPKDGTIERDSNGRATGVMRESAQGLIAKHVPPPNAEQLKAGVTEASRILNRFGITSISAALVTPGEMQAYHALQSEGELTVDVDAHQAWRSDFPGLPSVEEQRKNIDDRATMNTPRIRVEGIKMFIDGVPMLHTAAMLEPYNDKPDVKGELLHPQERLNKDVARFDKQGQRVKMHAVGDAAVRSVFDAVEAARQENGYSGPMHQMSHCNLVHPDDLKRFKKLNVVCELSPYFWAPGLGGPPLEHWGDLLGERREHLWGAGEVLAAGALLMAGSDWPVVGEPNPWPAIEGLVTRRDPQGKIEGAMGAEQAIDRWQAIAMYTTNPAQALDMSDARGTLTAGKHANLILLDTDVGSVPNEALGETQVLATMVRGRFEFIRNP